MQMYACRLNRPVIAMGIIAFIFCGHSLRSREVLGHDRFIPEAFRNALKSGEPFPLAPGWRWTYQRNGSEVLFIESLQGRKFGGIETTCLRAKGDSFLWSQRLFIACTGDELLQYAEGDESEREVILEDKPPLVLLPSEFREESFWESSSVQEESRSSHKFTGTILRQEAVEVPAGKFDAWRIDYVLDLHLGTEFDLRTWYTPGIGFVKIVKWRRSDGGDVVKKVPLSQPVVYELARIEAIAQAHPIDFPSRPIPVQELPKRVVAPADQLTLFADYEDRLLGGVVIYFVNRTARSIDLTLHDGLNPQLWLEAKGSDGQWHRASQLPWCHVGMSPLQVTPQHFVLLLGRQHEKGEEREVRYRLRQLNVVSNAGKGFIDPAQARQARYDVVSMAQADIDLVKEVLFDEIDIPEEARHDCRSMAIRRLPKLPRQEALGMLRRVLKSEALLQPHFGVSAEAYADMAPDDFQLWAGKILASGPASFRRELLRLSFVLRNGDDAEVRSILLRQLQDPATPDLRLVMSHLGSLRVPAVKDLLAEIAMSGKYPEELRIAAEYERDQWFGTKLLNLGLDVQYTRSRVNLSPVPIVVTLKNKSERTLEFSYDLPSDIIGLYLLANETPLDPHNDRFLKRKPGVVWFRDAGLAGKTVAKLVPGDSHEVRMNLLDYFDLPPGYEPESWSLTLFVSCSLPGIHDVPQLGREQGILRVKR